MRPQQQGFTLIEVLVALVIVAIALGAGIKAAGALANNGAPRTC
jgi:general secretion pathway protein I